MALRTLLTFLLGLALVGPQAAWAADGALSGSVELRYGEQRATENGDTVLDAAYFAQQYSLLYDRKGELFGGRGGEYDLALGYEWSSLGSEFNGEDFDADAGKILYRGDLVLAPGGLPFHLRLYSHDLTRSTFSRQTVETLFDNRSTDSFIPDYPITGIQNGQVIQTGATLTLGVRNGSYQGRYRDLLSPFPQLLLDYSEVYAKDLKSTVPQHYRDRDLAFISLNKKDNWFHYRVFEHKDFLNALENYEETSYMLGTVDQTYQRRWINFTNWIKVSADGSYTTGERSRVEDSAVKRFDANLFASARRSNWQATSFNTYNRVREVGTLRKTLELPQFLSGELNRNTSWRLRLISAKDQEVTFATGLEQDEDVLFASSRVDLFRQGRYVVSPDLEAEVKGGDRGEGYAARAGVEIYSNRIYRPRYDVFGSYSLARFEGTGDGGLETDFWEQSLRGRVETDLTSALRTGIEQDFLYGTGALDRTVVRFILPKSDLGLTLSDNSLEQREGDVFRSTTTWFGEHRSPLRISNRVELVYDVLSAPERGGNQFIVNHLLRYDSRVFLASISNQLVIGDHELTDAGIGAGILGGNEVSDSGAASYLNRTNLRYFPGRAWEGNLRVEYEWRDQDSGSSTHLLAEQDLRYSFFKTNGIVRKIAELRQELEYEEFMAAGGARQTATVLVLVGDYFPTRYTILGGRVQYDYRTPEDTGALTWYLTAGLDFEKVQIALDYSYGERSAGDTLPEREEQRWEVRVQKVF